MAALAGAVRVAPASACAGLKGHVIGTGETADACPDAADAILR